MRTALACLGTLACALFIEASWVASVRLVGSNRGFVLVLSAMAMNFVSNILLVVSDHLSMAAGVIGSGLGVLVGLWLPERWFRRPGPRPR